MVFERDLAGIQARKAVLQAECQLHRSLLELEFARCSGRLDLLARVGACLKQWKPYLPLALPVVGYLVARRWRSVARWSGRALAWRLFRGLLRL